MKSLVAALVLVLACGGKQPDAPSNVAPAAPSVGAMDSLLGQLEATRPFVVATGASVDCAAYTPDATAVLAKVDRETDAADSERNSTPAAAVAEWQTRHAAAIENLIAEVATPVRNDTSCEALNKDETWRKLARAIVALAQPTAVPSAVAARRELMREMSGMGATVASKADCQAVEQQFEPKLRDVTTALDAMSPIEKFVDDQVWEEEDEKRAGADPNLKKLMESCAQL